MGMSACAVINWLSSTRKLFWPGAFTLGSVWLELAVWCRYSTDCRKAGQILLPWAAARRPVAAALRRNTYILSAKTVQLANCNPTFRNHAERYRRSSTAGALPYSGRCVCSQLSIAHSPITPLQRLSGYLTVSLETQRSTTLYL